MSQDEDYAAFVVHRWASLVKSAILLGCTVHEAEDVTQTALMRCYTSWTKVSRAADPDAYVYRILLNTHADSRRRRWWGESPTDALPEHSYADADQEAVDLADAINRALSRLSLVNRQVLVLRYYAHLSEQQTAQALGIAAGTVKSRLSRALHQLAADADLADLHDGNHS